MTPPRNRQAAQAPTEPATDPLADLREPDDLTPGPGEPATEQHTDPLPTLEDPDGAPYPEEVQEAFRAYLLDYIAAGATVTPESWDETRDLAVVAMHQDTTAAGFLHHGGCGCRYIAGVILTAILPVQANQEEEAMGDVG